MITKAFIYAAGLGTRLRPYTLETPKPMLDVFGRPMIEYVVMYLAQYGVREVTVNACHLSEQLRTLPGLAEKYSIKLALSEQPDRYEHGGDLGYAKDFLASLGDDERFIAINADTIFHAPFSEINGLAQQVNAEKPALVAGMRSEHNPLMVHSGQIIGINETLYRPEYKELSYSNWDDFGLKILHSAIRAYLPEEPETRSFYDKTGVVGRLIADGKKALCRPLQDYKRVELGTINEYEGYQSNPRLLEIVSQLKRGLL